MTVLALFYKDNLSVASKITPLDNNDKEAENVILTPKTIEAFATFAAILKQIHIRLLAEGYVIQEGKIIKSECLKSYEQDDHPNRKNP